MRKAKCDETLVRSVWVIKQTASSRLKLLTKGTEMAEDLLFIGIKFLLNPQSPLLEVGRKH